MSCWDATEIPGIDQVQFDFYLFSLRSITPGWLSQKEDFRCLAEPQTEMRLPLS